MNSLINAIHFLKPQVIEEIESNINGKIKIVKIFGKPRMHVSGLLYSGGVLNQIWNKALKIINNQQLTINNVLILGLGGGTVANLINQSFPEVKIVGIEIDPIMIKLGKKYFGLEKIKNLKIVNQDAIQTIKSKQFKTRNFDFIVVDLYLGEQIPKKAESLIFLASLKKLVATNGFIIFNRLFYREHKKSTEEFINKIDKLFSKIELVRAWSNLLVICQK